MRHELSELAALYFDRPIQPEQQVPFMKLMGSFCGNRPLSHLNLWSIRSVLAVEPFRRNEHRTRQ